MKQHLSISTSKNTSMQGLYKNKIPFYRLNRPKFLIEDVKNNTQRFTYNEKMHKFTEETNRTCQDVYEYQLNNNDINSDKNKNAFGNIKIKKKNIKNLTFNEDFKDEKSFENKKGIKKQKEIRFSTRPTQKIRKRKQMYLMTEFDGSFLKQYCKLDRQIKKNQKIEQKTFKQFMLESRMYYPNSTKKHYKQKQNLKKSQSNQTLTMKMKNNSSKLINDMKQINYLNMKNQLEKQEIKKNNKIDKQINRFFQFVLALHKLQYNQSKIDQWVSHYILSNKIILKDIFLKEKGYNRASSTEIQYGIQNKQEIKLKAKKYKRIINFKQVGIQIDDLKDLNIFIEDILIQKQYFQLKRIEDFIHDKTKSIQNNYEDLKDQKSLELKKNIQKYSTKKRINPVQHYQTYNFFDDVKIIQDLYGPIKGVTRSNRRIFQDLTLIQVNTHKK